jgi:agmatinase
LFFILLVMISRVVSLLALSSATLAHSQKALGLEEESINFISSSIFTRNINLNSLQDPVILPPTYQARDYEDDGLFTGLETFAHLPFTDCTKSENNGTFDIGIIGHPFDLGVSYRPGARFGPNGARQGARRLSGAWGWR